MPHPTPKERATAVARVMAGESRRAVARSMGVSDSTVRVWVRAAESRGTAQENALADAAVSIAEQIEALQEKARLALIKRALELAPGADSIRDVMWAYGVATDKARLAAGKPTAITKSVDQMDVEIDTMLAEMARREAEQDRAEA